MRLTKGNIKEQMKGTFIELLGIQFLEDDSDAFVATMYVKPEFLQITGVMHGGATIAFTETLAGIGSNELCGTDEYALGIQISSNHLSPARPHDTVRGIATILHKGRSTHLWNIDVISEGTGKLISSVRITNAILKK